MTTIDFAPGDGVASRKRALLHEYDTTIAPQKLQLSHTLPQLWRMYEPTAGRDLIAQQALAVPIAASPSIQRPAVKRESGYGSFAAAPGMMPAAKRNKHDDIGRRMEELMKACSAIHTKLWKKKESYIFQAPVDPIKLKIPDYFTYIKHPMDLRTVKEKLAKHVYNSPSDYAADVRLIWHNCATFNQLNSAVRVLGDNMSDVFEKLWAESNLDAQWQELVLQRDPVGASLDMKLGMLGGQLRSAVAAMPPTSGLPAGGAADRDMSFIEKRKLSVALGELAATEMQVVLDIVMEEQLPGINLDSEEEVELDIDMLSKGALWRLQAYVDQVAHKMKHPHGVAGGAVGRLPGAGGAAPGGGGGGGYAERTSFAEKTPQQQRAPPTSSAPASANGNTPAESAGQPSDSDSEHGSVRDVKGSTMDEPHGQSAFVRDRPPVDESASNAKEQPTFVKDRADRKSQADVPINAANWSTLTENVGQQAAEGAAQPDEAGAGAEEDGDEVWKSFQSMAEQQKQREEEQKRREEQVKLEQERVERQRKEAQEALVKEEEERQRALREEEERQLQEQKRVREEQLEKELAEMQAKAGTANLTQQSDMSMMVAQMQGQAATKLGLEAVGLVYKDEVEEEDFEFENDD